MIVLLYLSNYVVMTYFNKSVKSHYNNIFIIHKNVIVRYV